MFARPPISHPSRVQRGTLISRLFMRKGLSKSLPLAWSERYARRDLADIATLAIANRVEGGSVTADLQELVDSLPSAYSKSLNRVVARFEDEDQPGPVAFFNAIEDTL